MKLIKPVVSNQVNTVFLIRTNFQMYGSGKSDPLVDEVQLLQANPQYAHVRHADSRETTVSIRHLAHRGSTDVLPWQDSQADNSSLSRDVTTSVDGIAADNSQSASGDAPTTTTSEKDTTAFENIVTPPSPATPTPPTNPIIPVTPRVKPRAPRRSERLHAKHPRELY